MSPTSSPAEQLDRGSGAAPVSTRVLVVVAAVAAQLGLFAGVALVADAPRLLVLAPVGIGAALIVGLVARHRIEWVLVGAIMIRPALDSVSGGGSGTAVTPGVLVGLAFVGVAVLWLISVDPRPTPLAIPLLVGAAFLAAAAVFATVGTGTNGVRLMLRLVTGLAPFAVLPVLVARGLTSWRRLATAVLVGAVPAIVLALAQAVGGFGDYPGPPNRVHGTLNHPSVLAAHLAIAIPVGVALAITERDRLRQRLLVVWCVLAAPALVLTYTRGAWIAVFLGVVLVAAKLRPRLLLGLPVVLVAGLLAAPSVLDRIRETTSTDLNEIEGDSVAWRFSYWADAVELVSDGRWLSGLGLDGIRTGSSFGTAAHNELVRTGVEMGLFGLVAFLILCAAVAVTLRRCWVRTVAGTGQRAMVVGATASAVSAGIFALSGNLISQVVLMWPLAALLVAAVAATLDPTPAPVDPAVARVGELRSVSDDDSPGADDRT